MTNYCQCGGKVALGTTFINQVEPEQEPYDNGFEEEVEGDFFDGREISFKYPLMVLANVCVKCGKVFNCEVGEIIKKEYGRIVEKQTKNQVEGEQ